MNDTDRQTYSESDLREALSSALADQGGGRLSIREYRAFRERSSVTRPTASLIQQRLGDGTWSDAVASVGGDDGSGPDHTVAEWMPAVEAAAEALQGPLTVDSYEEYRESASTSLPEWTTIARAGGDGSFQAAVERAGYETAQSQRPRRYTRGDVVAAVERVSRQLGEPPTTEEWKEQATGSDHTPSIATVYAHLDGWSEVRRIAESAIAEADGDG